MTTCRQRQNLGVKQLPVKEHQGLSASARGWDRRGRVLPGYSVLRLHNERTRSRLFGGDFDRATQHAGSQFLDQGLNPHTLQWEHGALTTGPLGNDPSFCSFKSPVRSTLIQQPQENTLSSILENSQANLTLDYTRNVYTRSHNSLPISLSTQVMGTASQCVCHDHHTLRTTSSQTNKAPVITSHTVSATQIYFVETNYLENEFNIVMLFQTIVKIINVP